MGKKIIMTINELIGIFFAGVAIGMILVAAGMASHPLVAVFLFSILLSFFFGSIDPVRKKRRR